MGSYLDKNLDKLNTLEKFNTIVYAMIKPHIRSIILEVGSGIGRFSTMLVKNFKSVELSDSETKYAKFLKKVFPKNRVRVLDIGKKSSYAGLPKFDTIVCLNVLEHVKDDILALREMKKITKARGKLILIVPAHKWLFNSLDTSVMHFRRYSKLELFNKTLSTGWSTEKISYFNFIGIPGWFISGLFNSKIFDSRLIKLFDVLFPLSRFIENKLLKDRIGLCMFVVLVNRN